MVDKTFGEIIVDVEQELYQASGLGVQVYAQDKIAQNIRSTFELIASDNKYRWKRFIAYATYTLDGVSGRATSPITVANGFDDVLEVYPEDSDAQLTKFTGGRNPSKFNGTRPLQYTYDPSSKIRIVPGSATGNIVVVARSFVNPAEWVTETVVPFDHLAMRYGACWQYTVDDAANPGMVQKFQQLFETRLKQLNLNQQQEPVSLSGGLDRSIPTNWYEAP